MRTVEYRPGVISCHHNYVSEERYEGMDLLVTRKGAIRAGSGASESSRGRWVPVRGLGNPMSFNSASHGAGRKMSRSAAKREGNRSCLRPVRLPTGLARWTLALSHQVSVHPRPLAGAIR
ncbi:RtcB family protein [Streptomyces sp. NPDC048479]|uniref:RtcB family protein n=1 Tax=Streptomyces sp. NPDC048479 TaxID=3154725 RepID=UPI00342CF622